MASKKTMPPSVQYQQSLYQQKLARARSVRRPGLVAYSESVNPITGEQFTSNDIASKMKRLNAWLKSNDRDFWDQHFAVQASRPAKATVGSTSRPQPVQSRAQSSTLLVQDTSRKYWEALPSKSRMSEIFAVPSEDDAPSMTAAITFGGFDQAKVISSIVLEVLVDCKSTDEIVGHLAVVENDPTDQTITDGLIFGLRYGSTELTSGRRFLKLSVEAGANLGSALAGKRIILKRSSASQQIFLRKWVEYTVVYTAPEFVTGQVMNLAHLP
ncbi:Coat protein [Privet leaf blotch-associated virus]|uniref:Coat protein n=1 Tax=Privet leaf blotch-associated virus TaxID=1811408 RepID=A0A1E1JQ40_9VIRU|nr:Coat protein [Privet leaf blotch-associated virus]CZS63620.1 Coat protein [Privet leaf blotch-associated virus]